MRGVYTASIKTGALTAARTLIYLVPPSNKAVEILSAEVTNADNETNEQVEFTLQRISSLGTPTATAITPSPHEQGDQAASSTVAGNVTASEPTYSSVEFGRAGASSLGGWRFDPTPEERPTVAGASTTGIGLRLLTAPTAPGISFVARITFREIG